MCWHCREFQSTPSLRKVTSVYSVFLQIAKFQSTPSLRKVTNIHVHLYRVTIISIHTFLTEGDVDYLDRLTVDLLFQSTPSLRKVTMWRWIRIAVKPISIHTFLTEGDQHIGQTDTTPENFNPHLPYGRWQQLQCHWLLVLRFQSTPSLRKVTQRQWPNGLLVQISIHTFLTEGDFL